jgi:hypothetical protein
MTPIKVIHWITIFTVLATFSVHAVNGISGRSMNVALAKEIEDEPAFQGTSTFVVATDDDAEDEQRDKEREARWEQRRLDREQRRFNRFLGKFERFYDRQRVCALTDNQAQALDLLYDTDTTTLDLSDSNVDVLTVQGQRLHTSDLRRILKTSGTPDIFCKILDHKKIFYLLFSGQIS